MLNKLLQEFRTWLSNGQTKNFRCYLPVIITVGAPPFTCVSNLGFQEPVCRLQPNNCNWERRAQEKIKSLSKKAERQEWKGCTHTNKI